MNASLHELAQEIADMTGALLNRSVLITDEGGVIIGCTNKERVGRLHSPSLPVIAFEKETYDDEESARKLGVLPGVTLPLSYFGRVAGTIAVSGRPEEVLPFALLIKKQAEMTLRERATLRDEQGEDSAQRALIEKLERLDPLDASRAALVEEATLLGVDLCLPRYAIAFEIRRFWSTLLPTRPVAGSHGRHVDAQFITKSILNQIRHTFRLRQDVSCNLRRDRFIVLASAKDAKGRDESLADICSLTQRVLEGVLENGVELRAGVSTLACGALDLQNACAESWKALSLGPRAFPEGRLFRIIDLQLENLLASLGKHALSKHIMERVEAVAAKGGGEELLLTFKTLFEHFFNQKEAASALNIHRNTLSYRIGRLADEVGADIGNFKEALGIYMAVVKLSLQ